MATAILPEDRAARRSEAAHKAHATRRKAAEAFERVANFEARLARLEAGGIPSAAPAVPAPPRVLEIRIPPRKPVKIDEPVHPIFDEVLTLAAARENIFIPGPAGCGKSHLCGRVAAAMEMEFDFISCTAGMSESKLTGRLVPTGEAGRFVFVDTPFIRRYESGGVFLFDEIDAADPNVLLIVNSALANGHLSLPDRYENPVAKRHPDFVCMAAANTFGRGADRVYVGRNGLDESTLDRFRVGTVPMDYDEAFERKLVAKVCAEYGKAADMGLYERIIGWRAKARAGRVERVISTRFILGAYKMVVGFGKPDSWAEERLFAGWRRDEIAKVKGA